MAGCFSYQQNELDLKELELNNIELDLLHSIIKSEHLDANKTIFRFVHRSMQDFLVANKIIEELAQISSTDEDSIVETTSDGILLNRKSLTDSSLSFQILNFLVDAVKDESISANSLIKLIKRSSNKTSACSVIAHNEERKFSDELLDLRAQKRDVNSSPMKDNLENNQPREDDFSIAASNAITILNMSGYNFNQMDLRGVSIPGANLSYGLLEGANFTRANLQKVNFTESWLKDATFFEATMKDIEFGLTPER